MRLAILFSGRIRDFGFFCESVKNHLVSTHEVDYFVSYTKDTTEEVLEEFIKCYEPKKMIRSDENYYFNYHKFPQKKKTGPERRPRILGMHLNRYNVYKLFEEYQMENNIQYDVILSCRTDFQFREKLDYDKLKKYIENDYICIPKGNNYDGINDRFALGNQNAMKIYMNCYTKIYDLLKQKVPFHPEIVLHRYLIKMNTKRHRFQYYGDINKKIIRNSAKNSVKTVS
jgi:hypothetical protein